jgi:hypothetical protein
VAGGECDTVRAVVDRPEDAQLFDPPNAEQKFIDKTIPGSTVIHCHSQPFFPLRTAVIFPA